MSYFEHITSKIVGPDVLKKDIDQWKSLNEKVVFTNGCFDIIHKGHVEYLAKAADLGQHLIIGLNTDESVRLLKGEGRPVKDEQTRALVLAAFTFVEKVVLFSDETPFELIKLIVPDVLVKGGDYKIEEIVGHDIVFANGGEVVTIDLVEGQSSTKFITKMTKV